MPYFAGIALFIALSERNSEDTTEIRDLLSAVGIFGFARAPNLHGNKMVARTSSRASHRGGEDSGVDPFILQIWLIGAASMQILFIGQTLMTMRLLRMENEVEEMLTLLEA